MIEGECVAQIRNFNIYVNHNDKKVELGPPKSLYAFLANELRDI